MVQQLALEAHPGHSCAVTLQTSFGRDLALDSLARVELMLRVGKAFGVELLGEAISQADTPRDVLRYLHHAPGQPAAGSATVTGRANTAGLPDLPDAAQTLVEALEWHCARQPDRLHILFHDDRHSEHPIRYLLDAARSIASGLTAQGLRPRQTVALMLPTGQDYLACFFRDPFSSEGKALPVAESDSDALSIAAADGPCRAIRSGSSMKPATSCRIAMSDAWNFAARQQPPAIIVIRKLPQSCSITAGSIQATMHTWQMEKCL